MEEVVDLAQLFTQADEARRQITIEEGEDDVDELDEDDEIFKRMFANTNGRLRTGKSVCIDLPCGDVHVCFGTQCPHAEVTAEKSIVCKLTGRVVGIEHNREQEAGWTGRSVGSANPDDTAGTPVGGWVKRRDMFAASSAAFQMARSFGDADQRSIQNYTPLPTRTPKPSDRLPAKRGALCVDDGASPASPSANRRQRTARRETWTRDSIEKLGSVAATVVKDLFIVDEESVPPAAVAQQTANASKSPTPPTPPKPVQQDCDPRLQNLDFVRALALRRYVKACTLGTQRLNMSVIHDVCIHANSFVRAQRKRAEAMAAAVTTTASGASSVVVGHKSRRAACYQGPVRNLLARLIVTLWHAACLTPHMRENRRGNDSFRPFAAGVLYSLKRGVYLEDGTCVVPELDSLAVHLPALRSTYSTPAAKQLQSSSHRGICSLHRSIASIGTMDSGEAVQVHQLLSDAARQAALLRELTHRFDGGAK
jgi:hypothetical protein